MMYVHSEIMISEKRAGFSLPERLRHAGRLNDVTHTGADIAALEHDLEAIGQYSFFVGNSAHHQILRPYIVQVKPAQRPSVMCTPGSRYTHEHQTYRRCCGRNHSTAIAVLGESADPATIFPVKIVRKYSAAIGPWPFATTTLPFTRGSMM